MIQPTTSRAYHAIGKGLPPAEMWLSKSHLWKFAELPYIWKRKHDRGDAFEPTPATDWGNLIDCLVTSPGEFPSTAAILDAPDFKTKAAREWRDEQRGNGMIPITAGTMLELEEAAVVLRDFLRSEGWYGDNVQMQVAMTADAVIDGTAYKCKGLADLLKDGRFLADIKTTGAGLDDYELRKTIANQGYFAQAYWYPTLLRAHGIETPDAFPLFFQESSWPYRCRRVDLTPEDIEQGRQWFAKASNDWHYSVTQDVWPGAELPPLVGGLPPWAKGVNRES